MVSTIRRGVRSYARATGAFLVALGVLTGASLHIGCEPSQASLIALAFLLRDWGPDKSSGSQIPAKHPTEVYTAPVAPAPTTLYLGAAAHVAGAADTDWRSDCEVLCTGSDACSFTIEALIHGSSNTSPPSREYDLDAGNALRLDDVLLNQFGRDGKAALRLQATTGIIIATNRTYNLLAAGNSLDLPVGSTFGQYIPAVRGGDAIAFGEEGRLVQLSHSFSGGGFRTNLGLVNVTELSIDVKIELYSANGAKLGNVLRTLRPFEYRQIGNIFASVTSVDVSDGYAVVHTTTEAGRFLAQASVVDNATGDPVFVPAQRLLQGSSAKAVRPPSFITAAAHISGAADTNWRTDVELHNASETSAQVTIDLLEHGRNNSNPTTQSLTIPAGVSQRFEDILVSLFGFSGKAALRLHTSGGEVVVSSRTYNLLGAKTDASLPAGATFGQYIPAVSETEAIHHGDTGLLIQLAQSADDGSGFRTNLVLVNARATPVTVDVEAFTADGVSLGDFQVTLQALEYRQINSVFGEVTAATVDDGYLSVQTETEGGAFFALASVVDNLTGDPVGMLHARVMAEGAQGLIGGASSVFDLLGGTVDESGEPVGLPDLVSDIQTEGIDNLLEAAAAAIPGSTAANGVLTTDYGSGWVDANGSVHTGSAELDLSALTVTSSSISGTIQERHIAHLVDGEPPSLDWIDTGFDLDIDAQGEVQGTIDVSGGPLTTGAKAGSPTLAGNIVIDTILCRYFPTGGSLTFTIGDFTTTITFTPDCDGTFDYSSDPRWDWLFHARDPEDAYSQEYIYSTDNAVIRTEGQFRFWQPEIGGATLAETTPGTIVYRFPFDSQVIAAQGGFDIFTFHWSYSQGHGFLYGSADGATWEMLAEIEPPEYGGWNRGGGSFTVPDSLLPSTELWFRVELYSYGPSAHNGGSSANTVQLARYDISRDNGTAWLQVDLE